MRQFAKQNIRAIFYTVIILIGLLFLINIEEKGPSLYFVSSVTLYSIILMEITYIWFVSKEKLKQLNLPLISNFSKFKQFIHHLLLPTFFYISITGFIYFNNQAALHLPILIFSAVTFTTLFINLKAFYLDKYSLEVKTYYVYDFIELTSFFCITLTMLDAATLFEWNSFFVLMILFILTILLLVLNLYQLNHLSIISIAIVSMLAVLVVSCGFILMTYTNLNNLAISAYIFLIYYLVFGFLTHKIEGTLKREIVYEYLAIFLLSLAFLFGIN